MEAQQSILLAVGAFMMFCGIGLMTYGVVRQRRHSAAEELRRSAWEEVLTAVASLSRGFGDFFGPDLAIKAGGVIFFAGLTMAVGAFFLPGPHV
jgi:hypothetical protein